MLAPLLALALAAAPTARLGGAVAHSKDLGALRSFLTSAALYAPALNPDPLGRSLASPLALDVLDLAAWPEAGLDPDGPTSFFGFDGDGLALVLPVKDAAKLLARARANLPSEGTVAESKHGGTTILLARRGPELSGGIAVSKTRAALWLGGKDPEILRAALSAKPSVPERAHGLAGPLVVFADGPTHASGFSAGLSPGVAGVSVDARVEGGKPILAPSKRDPFATLAAPAAVVAHASLAASALPEVRASVHAELQSLLGSMGLPVTPPPLDELLDGLAGPTALVVTGIDPERGTGEGPQDRAFLPSYASAAQVRDPAKALTQLGALVDLLSALPTHAENAPSTVAGMHKSLRVRPGRTFWFGLAGEVLYFADDLGARDALLGALAGATGADEHGGAISIDGARAAQSLGHLSLLDVARSNAIATLFAVAVEAGPLLKALGPTSFTLDGEPKGARIRGALRFVAPASAP